MKLARGGETGLVTRRLVGSHDPVLLHAALAAGAGPAPLLFRRTGGRALILVESALRLEASALDATVVAHSEGGELLLERLVANHGDHLVARAPRRLSLSFASCDHPDDLVRAAAATPLDALRSMIFGVTAIDRDETFALVAAGIAGFDHVDMVEQLPPRAAGDFPDLLFLLAETLIIIEPSGAARILAMAVGADDQATAHRQHHLAAERLARLVERCAEAQIPAEPEPPQGSND